MPKQIGGQLTNLLLAGQVLEGSQVLADIAGDAKPLIVSA
jgi:hypothetical protein